MSCRQWKGVGEFGFLLAGFHANLVFVNDCFHFTVSGFRCLTARNFFFNDIRLPIAAVTMLSCHTAQHEVHRELPGRQGHKFLNLRVPPEGEKFTQCIF